MGRKAIQVDEEVFNAVKAMYPDMSWTNILKVLLKPKGLPRDKPKGLDVNNVFTNVVNEGTVDRTIKTYNEASMDLYATKDDLKALKDKFSMVLTQLIKKNKLQR